MILFLLCKSTIVGTRNTKIEVESLFIEQNSVGFVPKGSTKNIINPLLKFNFFMRSFFSNSYTRANKTNTQCCQLNDCYHDKRKCACDAVKTGIHKSIKTEKKTLVTIFPKT